MKQKFLQLAVVLLLAIGANAQVRINPSFYGQNFWNTNYGNQPSNSPPTTVFSSGTGSEWDYLQGSGAKMIRVGGHDYDNQSSLNIYSAPHDQATGEIIPAGYVKIVDDIRSQGFEPVITVPFRDDYKRTIAAQADTAAEIVRVLNIVHKRNIRYFVIANEPGKDQNYYPPGTGTLGMEDVYRIRDYVTKFAVEMKKVDPNIKIIGPELEYMNDYLLAELFDTYTNPNSIKGQIPSTFQGEDLTVNYSSTVGKYFIDYLSFHLYSGYEDQDPSFTAIWNDERQGHADVAYYWKDKLQDAYDRYVRGVGLGSYDRSSSLKIWVDEFNMTSELNNTTYTASPTPIDDESRDPNNFLAGQLIVDLMAGMEAVESNVSAGEPAYWGSNFWSVEEGGKAYGFLHDNNNGTYCRKPTYWHYWMMANYFKGVFYPDLNMGNYGSGDWQRCVRAYACQSKDYIAVIIMSQLTDNNSNSATYNPNNPNTQYSFTIDFDGSGNSGDFVFDINSSLTTAYTGDVILNKSTKLLFFNCSNGSFVAGYEFKESDISGSPTAYNLLSGHSYGPGSIPTIPGMAASTGNCIGGSNGSLTAPSGAADYTWYKLPDLSSSVYYSNSTNVVTGLGAGMYQVKITGGCEDLWLTSVVEEKSPTLKQPNDKYEPFCSNSNVSLQVNGSSNVSTWSWAPSTGLSSTSVNNPTANPSVTTTYTVFAADNGGCSVSDQVKVIRQNASTSNEKLYIRDDATDAGAEPNNTNSTGAFWESPDIWITKTLTGSPGDEAEYTTGPEPNYIHILIHNSGSSAAEGLLNVYWAKASTGGNWPSTWVNAVDNQVTPTLVYGDQVCVRKDVSVSANSTLEVILPWFPPNPGDYNTFGDPNHFCILARLYTGCGITGETTVTYMNNVLSKQVAQRNVTVVDQLPGIVFPPRGQIYDVFAQNVDNATRTIKFEFVGRDNAHSENFFDYGHAFMYMDPDLYDAWTTGGSVGTGVTDLGNNLVEIDQNNANIRNISFDAYQQFGNGMRFTYFSQDNDTLDFDVDVIEKKTALGQADVVFGGERYVISPVECPAAQVVNDHIDIDNGCGADLEVDDPKSGVEYTWYDENGDEAGEGSATTVYPTATTYYVLKAAQKGCILTDTVFVSVNDHECNGRLAHHPAGPGTSKWISIQPNPSAGSTTIICNLAEGEAGEFSLLNMYGEVVYSVTVSGKTRVILDASQFANGIYNCVLSGKGTGIITQRLTVSH